MLLKDLLEVMVVLANSVGEPRCPLPHEQLPLRKRVVLLAEYPCQLLKQRYFVLIIFWATIFNFNKKMSLKITPTWNVSILSLGRCPQAFFSRYTGLLCRPEMIAFRDEKFLSTRSSCKLVSREIKIASLLARFFDVM